MLHRSCVVCGREFDTPFHRRTCCSDECSRKHVAVRQRDRARARRAARVAAVGARVCVVCGGEIKSRKLGTVFCSEACYHRAYLRRMHGRCISDEQNLVKCAACGVMFRPVAARQRFCCAACRMDAERGRRDASIEAGKLSIRQAEQVRADMRLPPADRFAASSAWTSAMRNYARRLYVKQMGAM